MPLALGLMALQFVSSSSEKPGRRLMAFAVIAGAFGLGLVPNFSHHITGLVAIIILSAALLGAPVFVAMGGLALLLFFKDAIPVSAVSAEVYRLIASPTLPAIPLLTGAGYILAEGGASHRLVRFFKAVFGWMPGGLAVMVAAVCAVFTTFTGFFGTMTTPRASRSAS